MKKTLTTLFCFIFALPLFAQRGFSGKIQANGVGIPEVIVQIFGGKEPFGTITGTDGNFFFRLAANDTATSLRFLIDEPNYAPLDTLCSLKNKLIFTLEPRAKELGEATVKGQRIFERSEGNVRSYQPHLKSLTKHAKAENALRQVPTLTFQNGSFTILGKEGTVTFFIDGREASDLQLKLIDAKNILRIEVQDYDYKNDLPNGSVNIVLKKKSERVLFTELSGSSSLIRKRVSFNPIFSYDSDALTLSYIGAYFHNLQTPSFENKRVFENDSTDGYRWDNRIQMWQHISEVSGLWAINRKSSLSFTYTLFGAYSHTDKAIDHAGNRSHTIAHNNFLKHSAAIVLRRKLNPRNTFYLKGWGDLFTDKFADARYPDDTRSRTQGITLQANLTTDNVRLGKTAHNLTYGYKTIFRENIIHRATERPYNTIHQLFCIDEFQLVPDLTGVWSLRADYAQIGTQAFKKHFFDLLPQFSLKYFHRKWGNWRIGYESAVYRPAADYLNPAIKRENDVSSVKGNPHLLPERSQKLTFYFSKMLGNTYLSLSASHTFGKEQIRDIYEASGDYNIYTYANIGSENTTRLSLGIYRTFAGGRMTLNGGATLTRSNYFLPTLAGLLSLSNRGWGTSAHLNLNYLTTKEWSYELSMNYYDRRISSTHTNRTDRPSFSLNVEKEVGKHWAFRASISDNSPTLHTSYLLKGLQQNQKTSFHAFNLSVGVRYRFGKPLIAGVEDKDGGTSDLKTTRK